jgi:APA family basic amino acid/polyamine antiporter
MQATDFADVESAEAAKTEPATIGLWDAVSVIIGIVVGAGIYETAPMVLGNVTGPGQALLVWGLGGVLSLIGACCYAELASAYPRAGGDYVYLSRAYAPFVGYLFGWSQLAILMTGSIGMMAYVFADYSVALFGLSPRSSAALAAFAVIALTLLNLAGVAIGKTAQNVLSWVKVLGLLAIVIAGVAWGKPAALTARPPAESASFGVAMILVLYTYGGWNDAAFVAAEVRDRKRNLPRALLLGTAGVAAIYLLVNAAFIAAIGFERARASDAIAKEVLALPLGAFAGSAMALLVVVSALGAANALIFTGSRVHAALGADYSVLAPLGRWTREPRTPLVALLAGLTVTLILIGMVGTSFGRGVIDRALGALGFAGAEWSGHGGFDTLLRCTAPVFWLFFLLTGVSLFVLRKREPERQRPFKVPLYPILPLIFCGMCAYMLYSSIDYAGSLALVGVVPVLLGVPLYFASKRRPSTRRST